MGTSRTVCLPWEALREAASKLAVKSSGVMCRSTNLLFKSWKWVGADDVDSCFQACGWGRDLGFVGLFHSPADYLKQSLVKNCSILVYIEMLLKLTLPCRTGLLIQQLLLPASLSSLSFSFFLYFWDSNILSNFQRWLLQTCPYWSITSVKLSIAE